MIWLCCRHRRLVIKDKPKICTIRSKNKRKLHYNAVAFTEFDVYNTKYFLEHKQNEQILMRAPVFTSMLPSVVRFRMALFIQILFSASNE